MCAARHVLDAARRGEAPQRVEQRPRQQHLLPILGQRLHLAREFARVLGQDSHALRDGNQIDVEQLALGADLGCLVAHDRQCPEHEDEAGLLLQVLDQHPHAAFAHVVGVLLGQHVLLGDDLGCVRAHNRNVKRVHDDDRDDQGEQLVDEFDRDVLLLHTRAPCG